MSALGLADSVLTAKYRCLNNHVPLIVWNHSPTYLSILAPPLVLLSSLSVVKSVYMILARSIVTLIGAVEFFCKIYRKTYTQLFVFFTSGSVVHHAVVLSFLKSA